MKVIITGCKGQVGQELALLAASYGCEAIALDREALDITDAAAVDRIVQYYKPDTVINAAAYTAVDKAENDVDLAYAINEMGATHLAQSCADLDIPLVHISTDYVFDGTKVGAYNEEDVVNPLGVYGKSKLAGEMAVRRICKKYYILRTSWVFSKHGSNFVKTMLRLGSEREELSVVADQYGKPTSASEVARAAYMMLNSKKDSWGTYHIAQPDVVSWYEFAQEIFVQARNKGFELKLSSMHAITTSSYPTAAKRPLNSALDCAKLEATFNYKIEPWKANLYEIECL